MKSRVKMRRIIKQKSLVSVSYCEILEYMLDETMRDALVLTGMVPCSLTKNLLSTESYE